MEWGSVNTQTLYHFAENHDQLIENEERLKSFPVVKYL